MRKYINEMLLFRSVKDFPEKDRYIMYAASLFSWASWIGITGVIIYMIITIK